MCVDMGYRCKYFFSALQWSETNALYKVTMDELFGKGVFDS